MFDSGASESFIRSDIAYEIGTTVRLTIPWQVELGRGIVRIKEQVEAVVIISGFRIHWNYLLFPKMTEELVIGADFLQRYRIKLDPEREKVIINPRYLRVKLVSPRLRAQVVHK